MKTFIERFLPRSVVVPMRLLYQRWTNSYARLSYAQEGEDILLERFVEDRQTGFYVDIGAHHPMRFSNTYRFYRQGWRGLNVDANPGSMVPFTMIRPRDINIEAAVSSKSQELTYYVFNDPALNTFDETLAKDRSTGGYFIVDKVTMFTQSLAELLEKHLPAGTKIDLLSVDVEGLDYDVLSSNDWKRFSPEFILVESFGSQTSKDSAPDPMGELLRENGYVLVARTMNTLLFQLPRSSR